MYSNIKTLNIFLCGYKFLYICWSVPLSSMDLCNHAAAVECYAQHCFQIAPVLSYSMGP